MTVEPMAEDATDSPRYRAPALEKGLDILELLAGQQNGLSQAQIAKSLARSVSEIFRMLSCLERRGYIAQMVPGDQYHLTLKLFELAHRHPPTRRLAAEAQPLMLRLARQLNQSCHLTVHHDGAGLIIAQIDAPGTLSLTVRLGAEIDLATTASGHVLLAFQDAEERSRMLERRRPGAPPLPDALEQALAAARADGYRQMASSRIRGVCDLSMPVFDFRGAVVAALTVPYVERLDIPAQPVEAARSALAEAACALSAALGARAASDHPPFTDGRGTS